jgi:hypothetical protein
MASHRAFVKYLSHPALAGVFVGDRRLVTFYPETGWIMDRVPLLRFHLDSGHAKLKRGHDHWDEYLHRLGPKLRPVHLAENDGTADQHLPRVQPQPPPTWPENAPPLPGERLTVQW